MFHFMEILFCTKVIMWSLKLLVLVVCPKSVLCMLQNAPGAIYDVFVAFPGSILLWWKVSAISEGDRWNEESFESAGLEPVPLSMIFLVSLTRPRTVLVYNANSILVLLCSNFGDQIRFPILLIILQLAISR